MVHRGFLGAWTGGGFDQRLMLRLQQLLEEEVDIDNVQVLITGAASPEAPRCGQGGTAAGPIGSCSAGHAEPFSWEPACTDQPKRHG